MRQLNTHLSSGGSNVLQVVAVDQPVPGLPTTRYDVTGFNTVYNPAARQQGQFTRLPIIFATGDAPVDAPQNGVTNEALLAVVADHLRSQQETPEACLEYQMAMDYINAALGMLRQRPAANSPMGNTAGQAYAGMAL